MLLAFNMAWPCIFCGTVFVCPQSPYRDNDMIDFVYCPLSRDNPPTFGFEFHLRTLPCAFSRRSVNQAVALLLSVATPC